MIAARLVLGAVLSKRRYFRLAVAMDGAMVEAGTRWALWAIPLLRREAKWKPTGLTNGSLFSKETFKPGLAHGVGMIHHQFSVLRPWQIPT